MTTGRRQPAARDAASSLPLPEGWVSPGLFHGVDIWIGG